MVDRLGWIIAAVLAAVLGQMVIILIAERKRQVHLVAWIFIVMVCPIVGFIAYLLIGRSISKRTLKKQYESLHHLQVEGQKGSLYRCRSNDTHHMDEDHKLYRLLRTLEPFSLTTHNRTEVLTNGEVTYDAILSEIQEARHSIHLEYYTIRNDRIGQKFLRILIEKASAGVEVRIIYDGFGSMHLNSEFLNPLRLAGVETACFSPLRLSLTSRRMNFRNHRKIVIVDGKVGFVGGINIGDEYVGADERLGFWRDTHLRLEGDSVYQLQQLFELDWLTVTNRIWAKRKLYYPEHTCEEHNPVLLIPGTPGVNHQRIVEALFSTMAAAKQRIYATSPYFVPDPRITASLLIAARSGVDVRLILPGVSDSNLVLLASLSYVQEMLDAGVRIYRYQKGFIHAKVLLIDSMLASVGSANLDMRSMYSNYELLALLFDEKALQHLEQDFMNDLACSKELVAETFNCRPRRQKSAEAVMNILSPLL